MVLIDVSDFTGIVNIGGKGSPEISSAIDAAIQEYSPSYLIGVLGQEMYHDMVNDETGKYDSLIKKLRSPVSCYVFYMYQKDTMTMAGSAGDSRSRNENSDRTPEVYRMARAWNHMVKKNHEILVFLRRRHDYYDLFDEYKIEHNLFYRMNSMGI